MGSLIVSVISIAVNLLLWGMSAASGSHHGQMEWNNERGNGLSSDDGGVFAYFGLIAAIFVSAVVNIILAIIFLVYARWWMVGFSVLAFVLTIVIHGAASTIAHSCARRQEEVGESYPV